MSVLSPDEAANVRTILPRPTPARIIAITGATGFVGTETLEQLLAADFSVRALTRRPQQERDSVIWVEGALDRPETLDELVTGADVVLHIAGVVNALDRAGFAAGNISGTQNVIAAMEKAGVNRLIHISSLAARNRDLSNYCWSKALAEDAVLASSLASTIIRPPAIYGPRDTEFSELLRIARYGVLPVPAIGRASLLHVRDLARLLVKLCGNEGDKYIGALWEVDDGTPGGLSHKELAAAFGRAFGKKIRALPVPSAAIMGIAGLDRFIRKQGAKLTPDRARYMCFPDWVANTARTPPADFWAATITPDIGLAEIAAPFRQ
ncbi:MAG: NAD-dependent epimerase/dehydratase family protein [Sphingobium sp.]|nr:NAD-dependent epimerase/dehydratase family protein [Sphingobium sp.]